MDILKIINDKELQDIPVLYILRVIHSIQKEIINDRPCSSGNCLYKEHE